MTKHEIFEKYQSHIYNSIAHLKGQRLNKNTVHLLKHHIERAVLEVYQDLPSWYKAVYQLEMPQIENLDIVVNGSEITIQWKKPLIPDDVNNGGTFGSTQGGW